MKTTSLGKGHLFSLISRFHVAVPVGPNTGPCYLNAECFCETSQKPKWHKSKKQLT